MYYKIIHFEKVPDEKKKIISCSRFQFYKTDFVKPLCAF